MIRCARYGSVHSSAEVSTDSRRHRPVVGGDDEVLAADRRCAGSSSNGTQPVHSASPVQPSAGREPSPLARIGMRPGRVVADVAVDVGIHEVLRRHDEVAERGGELGPVARLVHLEEGASVVPSSGSSAVHRNASGSSGGGFGVAFDSRVVGVDRVGDERTVPRDAHARACTGARALDGDRFAE